VVDYRANIERQAREQRSVGSIINIVVGVLIALVILGGLLSGYGAYVLTKQVHQQSVTLTDLDNRYSIKNQALEAQIVSDNDALNQSLTQAKAQIGRQQELILRQQESINKLSTAGDKLASDDDAVQSMLRQERATRAAETANLRARVHLIESQSRFGQ
jgi:hypothetical protein